MRSQVIKALEVVEDLLESEDLPDKHRKALLQIQKYLLTALDSVVDVKSKVRDITYTLQELAETLGLEVKLSSPRLLLEDEDLVKTISESAMADIEIEGEKAIIRKLVAAQQTTQA
ncbi:MAG: hypothetical protein ACP5II_05430 [Infirmifilum sp.]|jgi:hypothetical protein|uniref:Uncharacterized protein n=1 Tax=Infirmifilum uzonense TaxID=1550241 RepID=A0A0F7FJJ6_9CREN|nr:hypothetical protein [Infirmifilum uzonense]AKG39215.1 hypothetical protein MA03_08240 [Infirmifilum uzonense]